MQIIDGRQIASRIEALIKQTLETKKIDLSVASIFVGAAKDSALYTKRKAETAKRLGINFFVEQLEAATTDDMVAAKIIELNQNEKVDSYIVQLPLPNSLRSHTDRLLNLISPTKDVDGLTEANRDKLLNNQPGRFIPTPVAAVITILNSLHNPVWWSQLPFSATAPVFTPDLQDKECVIISDGDFFAPVLKFLLERAYLKVNIVNSQALDLVARASQADILISAIGRPEFLRAEHIKSGATIIDVGTTLVNDKTVGDFYWPDVEAKAGLATPVPGGVGPVTVAMLFANALFLKLQQSKN
jgi:methylenetetrahydrofolate dehydrogenase (NADP+) / methenyltetrahydrofolate cyclohydrolase